MLHFLSNRHTRADLLRRPYPRAHEGEPPQCSARELGAQQRISRCFLASTRNPAWSFLGPASLALRKSPGGFRAAPPRGFVSSAACMDLKCFLARRHCLERFSCAVVGTRPSS